ncbi:MAG: M28 family peptidase [Acidobacteriota bacterium]
MDFVLKRAVRGPGLLLLGLALSLAGVVATRSKGASAGLVSARAGMEHVRFLAADRLAGRGNGKEGLEEAARYIADRFEEFGLEPAGDSGSYFQPFTVTLTSKLGAESFLEIGGRGIEAELRLHRDFEPMSFSAEGEIEAPLVFVGYGITAPEHDYDDYDAVDVRGKVALMLRHTPREKRPDGPFAPDRGHATFVAKAVNARSHGARALLIVNDPINHRGEPDLLLEFGVDLGVDDLGIPSIHLKREVAEKLFASVGKDLARVQESIDDRLAPSSFGLAGTKAHLRVEVRRRRGEVKNVLGYLPSATRDGGEEFLVVAGHYDHLGLGGRRSEGRDTEGQIHNGADDNASGTAGVLELARVFSTRLDLKRGILFSAFAGEELGLRGSRHYVRNPTLPLARAVAMLNLDMIGRLRDDRVYVGGADSSPGFRPVLERLGTEEDLAVSFGFSGYGASDHSSFLLREIPSLFFFTGLHDDYHKPSDDWERLNPAGMAKVLRLAYRTADYLQALPERPPFRSSRKERRR